MLDSKMSNPEPAPFTRHHAAPSRSVWPWVLSLGGMGLGVVGGGWLSGPLAPHLAPPRHRATSSLTYAEPALAGNHLPTLREAAAGFEGVEFRSSVDPTASDALGLEIAAVDPRRAQEVLQELLAVPAEAPEVMIPEVVAARETAIEAEGRESDLRRSLDAAERGLAAGTSDTAEEDRASLGRLRSRLERIDGLLQENRLDLSQREALRQLVDVEPAAAALVREMARIGRTLRHDDAAGTAPSAPADAADRYLRLQELRAELGEIANGFVAAVPEDQGEPILLAVERLEARRADTTNALKTLEERLALDGRRQQQADRLRNEVAEAADAAADARRRLQERLAAAQIAAQAEAQPISTGKIEIRQDSISRVYLILCGLVLGLLGAIAGYLLGRVWQRWTVSRNIGRLKGAASGPTALDPIEPSAHLPAHQRPLLSGSADAAEPTHQAGSAKEALGLAAAAKAPDAQPQPAQSSTTEEGLSPGTTRRTVGELEIIEDLAAGRITLSPHFKAARLTEASEEAETATAPVDAALTDAADEEAPVPVYRFAADADQEPADSAAETRPQRQINLKRVTGAAQPSPQNGPDRSADELMDSYIRAHIVAAETRP